jgi:hypothetical protein
MFPRDGREKGFAEESFASRIISNSVDLRKIFRPLGYAIFGPSRVGFLSVRRLKYRRTRRIHHQFSGGFHEEI